MQYSYQFSEELQQEWEWSERYATQPEILRYANHVADRFDLRRDIQFDTRVHAAAFDEAARPLDDRPTADGSRLRAQFCIMATGCLSAHNTPRLRGPRHASRGDLPHRTLAARRRRLHRQARRRDRHRLVGDPVHSADRRSRRSTCSCSSARRNYTRARAQRAAGSPTRGAQVKADYAGLRAETPRRMFAGVDLDSITQSAVAIAATERQREYEARWGHGGVAFIGAFAICSSIRSQRHRGRVRARQDPRHRARPRLAAKLLTPKYDRSAASACASTPTTTRRTTARTSRWST